MTKGQKNQKCRQLEALREQGGPSDGIAVGLGYKDTYATQPDRSPRNISPANSLMAIIYIVRSTGTCRKTIWLFAKEKESKRRGRAHPSDGKRSLRIRLRPSSFGQRSKSSLTFSFNPTAWHTSLSRSSGRNVLEIGPTQSQQGHRHRHGGWHMHGSLGSAWKGNKETVTIRKLLQRFASSTRASSRQHQVSANTDASKA
ncbi:uncharacterized protein BDZ83DRAFT_355900 [Colletotrichum acutatum]|uniref:Uncharacterized protein n=1 Tax=Glomerella acutata TaxID=27357 RepID=A0AAD8UI31_GLOAC|nr:uncharacterized protein BDZ83DRAFT_355900 [Colletotrichum acutatum]KAK1724326.1 hypothetical protein BDZ83DRAFT_355900 [Colletotrichum acutatum]